MASFNYKLLLLQIVMATYVIGDDYPIPYRRTFVRPPRPSLCLQAPTFCPDGFSMNSYPFLDDNDNVTISVFRTLVVEFRKGLFTHYKVWKDSLYLSSAKLNRGFSLEYAEMSGPFNGTFPHVSSNNVTWCNQAASCMKPSSQPKADKKHTLTTIGTMSGVIFNDFVEWVMWDNNTGVFYNTWIAQDSKKDSPVLFETHDSASWTHSAVERLFQLGAKFDQKTVQKLTYSRLSLISKSSKYLGNTTSIFGKGGDQTTAGKIIKFFKTFKESGSILTNLRNFISDATKFIRDGFYLYFNDDYYHLQLHGKYVEVTEDHIPIKM